MPESRNDTLQVAIKLDDAHLEAASGEDSAVGKAVCIVSVYWKIFGNEWAEVEKGRAGESRREEKFKICFRKLLCK